MLSRHATPLEPGIRHVVWDGRNVGDWAAEIDGADAVINLAGRTVSCRYTEEQPRRDDGFAGRLDPRRRAGDRAGRSPAGRVAADEHGDDLRHRHDAPNDEYTGIIGGHEPDVPAYWAYSVGIAQRWEAAQQQADTPHTRKVALRSAMVMSPDSGGVFDVLRGWCGSVSVGRSPGERSTSRGSTTATSCAPSSCCWCATTSTVRSTWPHRPAAAARADARAARATGRRFGLPATKAMAELGALSLRTDTELLLKSRRVVPTRLIDAGFEFEHPTWAAAAAELAGRPSPTLAIP